MKSSKYIFVENTTLSTYHRHTFIVAAFGAGSYLCDTTTTKKASFLLLVSRLPSTIKEILGFTLATDTCEHRLFTMYI